MAWLKSRRKYYVGIVCVNCGRIKEVGIPKQQSVRNYLETINEVCDYCKLDNCFVKEDIHP